MASTSGEDPVLASSRREAALSLAVWAIAMVYTVTYCYLFGYNRSLESLTFVLGFPDWVFWGVVVPWLVCVVFSWLFAFVLVKDVDLGVDPDEPTEEADDEETGGEVSHG